MKRIDINKIIGKKLKSLRNSFKPKVTQEELGKALGLHQSAIARVEYGKQCLTPNELYACSRFFNVDMNFFFSVLK